MGCISSLLGVPEVNFPAEDVAGAIKDNLESMPAELKKAEAEVAKQYGDGSKAVEIVAKKTVDGKEATIKCGTLAAGTAADSKEYKTVVGKLLASGSFPDTVAEAVWAVIEPNISEQIPEETPEKAKKIVLDGMKKQVSKAVVDQINKKLAEAA
eukprot:TRINITY_DN21711_c0_g1_i1.p1 TRINITY_DN21711_c0_g1~~TRINITY_DN21711_c0_g1_i1.p1  ORF type:complete len:173 (-),score=47.60 TRINITY_DN21711_c0_g1_i1:48-509(-)